MTTIEEMISNAANKAKPCRKNQKKSERDVRINRFDTLEQYTRHEIKRRTDIEY
jgi:hypothetical protein